MDEAPTPNLNESLDPFKFPTLEEQIKENRQRFEGPMGLQTVAIIVDQVAKSIDDNADKVHGNLKPKYIRISKPRPMDLAETPVTIDVFGFVPGVAPEHVVVTPSESQPSEAPDKVVLTMQYAAPEIFTGEEPTVQSEVYSLACIAYEMLTGEQLFDNPAGETTEDQALAGLIQHRTTNGIDPNKAEILRRNLRTRHNREATGIIAEFNKALKNDPKDRHKSAEDFADSLITLFKFIPPSISRSPRPRQD